MRVEVAVLGPMSEQWYMYRSDQRVHMSVCTWLHRPAMSDRQGYGEIFNLDKQSIHCLIQQTLKFVFVLKAHAWIIFSFPFLIEYFRIL